jgi:hypothetical protein
VTANFWNPWREGKSPRLEEAKQVKACNAIGWLNTGFRD